ncbi:MAG TPA: hypothetical protein VK846_00535 [Candidatus Limnocylindria bacterium]|nr:hypothetical protein [Candidatus Limnocylindria bacterium]
MLPTIPSLCALLLASLVASHASDLAVRTRMVQEGESAKPFTCLDLTYKDERFTLVPPASWRMETDPSLSVLRFYSREGAGTIVISFSETPASGVLATADSLRGNLGPDLAGAEIVAEFPAYAGAAAGKGVELSFVLQGRAMRAHAAAVPLARGHVSFVLTCNADKFKNAQSAIGSLMSSFQRTQGAAPKIEVSRLAR